MWYAGWPDALNVELDFRTRGAGSLSVDGQSHTNAGARVHIRGVRTPGVVNLQSYVGSSESETAMHNSKNRSPGFYDC